MHVKFGDPENAGPLSKYDSPSSVHSVVPIEVPAYHVQARLTMSCMYVRFGSVPLTIPLLSLYIPSILTSYRLGTLRFTYGHVCPLIIFHFILVYILTVWFPFTHPVSMSWLIVYSDLLV